MNSRPLSVTIVAWYLIITAALGAIGLAMAFANPAAQAYLAASGLSLESQMVLGVVGVIIAALCGFYILRGANWARYLYIGWTLLGVAIAMATIGFTPMMLVSLAILALVIFLLFRKPANAFFTGAATNDVTPAAN